MKSVRSGALQVIQLSTPVRLRAEGTVKVENPLVQPVQFQCVCSSVDIQMPNQLMVPAQSEVSKKP